MNVAYEVYTKNQRTLLEYRTTIHCATRATLVSLLFGCYPCILCILCPLISRKGLFATSWRRVFGLFRGDKEAAKPSACVIARNTRLSQLDTCRYTLSSASEWSRRPL